ncbi:hypothetical protein TRVL_03398 [Trypanosoma vivax]|nr:hypothetical protein TRVL_03398 [Trypanosoma vivax]
MKVALEVGDTWERRKGDAARAAATLRLAEALGNSEEDTCREVLLAQLGPLREREWEARSKEEEAAAEHAAALALLGEATHLAAQIDGWMTTLSTCTRGTVSHHVSPCIDESGNGESAAQGQADAYTGTKTSLNAELAKRKKCLTQKGNNKTEVSKLKSAVAQKNFITPFDGTTNGAIGVASGASHAEEGCNLLSGDATADRGLYDTTQNGYPFAIVGRIWTIGAMTNTKGIKMRISKTSTTKSKLELSNSPTITLVQRTGINADSVEKISRTAEHTQLNHIVAELEGLESWAKKDKEGKPARAPEGGVPLKAWDNLTEALTAHNCSIQLHSAADDSSTDTTENSAHGHARPTTPEHAAGTTTRGKRGTDSQTSAHKITRDHADTATQTTPQRTQMATALLGAMAATHA